jgi:hypothetical protein
MAIASHINNVAKTPEEAVLMKLATGLFCVVEMEKIMSENFGYIKAKIKTQRQIQKVYPPAEDWGKPLDSQRLFPSADEVVLPYLGKTVWLRKKRHDSCRFYYEIKDTDGFIVILDWIDYFDSEDLVSSAVWKDFYDPSVVDDTWLNYYESRVMIIDDLLIITG